MRYQLRYVRARDLSATASDKDTRYPDGSDYRAVTVSMHASALDRAAYAHAGGRLATGLVDVTDDPAGLDSGGFWMVVATFEGELTCCRFDEVSPGPMPRPRSTWPGVAPTAWRTSMSSARYQDGVRAIRDLIASGEVYQVNLCRVLDAPLDDEAELDGLADTLAAGNPAPHACRVFVPEAGLDVVSASPELFLRRDGDLVESAPIKGTGSTAADLTGKDVAENVMIVDLVRNDLGRVCRTGSVTVHDALQVQSHPGLVHLVSTVRGRLAADTSWAEILAAAFPPGSVSGAPKSTALDAIGALETTPRGPYCGAIGWVDADRRQAELAVGIRTFWRSAGRLHFGTGAGITWGSDPRREWQETELKAARLLGLAAEDGRTG